MACDFFQKPILTWHGIKNAYCIAFIHYETRRVFCSFPTFSPHNDWLVQQARNAVMYFEDHGIYPRYLIRDNDQLYCKKFDAFLRNAFKNHHPKKRVRIITTAFNCPDMNPYIESFIGTIKRECLNYFVFLGLTHMNRVIKMYLDHYHTARPHQGKNNECLDMSIVRPKRGEIKRRAVVGGLINEYYREAA